MVGRGGIDPALGGGGDGSEPEIPAWVAASVASQATLLDEAIRALSLTAARLRVEQQARAALERRVDAIEGTIESIHEDLAHLHAGVAVMVQALDERWGGEVPE